MPKIGGTLGVTGCGSRPLTILLVSGDWVEAHNKKRRSPRRRLIGRDLDGEMWTVIIERTSEPGFWRPITGWQSSLGEIDLYNRMRIQFHG